MLEAEVILGGWMNREFWRLLGFRDGPDVESVLKVSGCALGRH